MKPGSTTVVRCSLFAIAALGALLAASRLLPVLNRQREDLGLHGITEIGKVPPGIALGTTALGPFRGILIDFLWIRASRLQQEGKVFELVQLFEWIGALEPRFPMVWAHAAWNLAYNVSVKFPVNPDEPTPKEWARQCDQRWRWVQRGIEILRNRGIPLNPRAPLLYRELAWIYQHKIGQDLDDAHVYYKVQLALEMQNALGQPPYRERLEAIAAAPESRSDLLRNDAVRALVDALSNAGADPFEKPLAIANRSPDLPPAVRATLDEPGRAEAVARLEAFLRARHLQDNLQLEPARMLDLMNRFGPLEDEKKPGRPRMGIDWRLPDALALYWAARSVQLFGADVTNAANADRMLFHALIGLYERGNLRFAPPQEDGPAQWIGTANFQLLARVVKVYEDRVKFYRDANPIRESFLNFLRDTIVSLYIHNKRKLANKYLRLLQQRGPEPEGVLLEEFVAQRFKHILETLNREQVINHVIAYLVDSLRWASIDDMDQAVGREDLAKLLYRKYQERRATPRQQLPPFRELRKRAMMHALMNFAPFQIERLRQLYRKAVAEAEKELEKLKLPRRPPGTPPAKQKGKSQKRPSP